MKVRRITTISELTKNNIPPKIYHQMGKREHWTWMNSAADYIHQKNQHHKGSSIIEPAFHMVTLPINVSEYIFPFRR
jgi:hypothetical protein